MRFQKSRRILMAWALGTLIMFATLDAIHSAAPTPVSKVSATDRAPKTYSLYFPKVAGPSGAGISFVRVVLSCGRVAAVTRIPDDWYIRTFRPAVESASEWSEFRFASNAIDFEAGHGVTRLRSLTSLDGAIKVAVEDDSCFDITADVGDDMEDGWKIRLRNAQLQLRD